MAIRHDAVSGQKTWMHGGRDDVLEYVRQHEDQWRWWDNPQIQRPLVSVVALKAADEFEAGRPEKGVAIRVRCAWENATQGTPKNPIAELVKLLVDGAEMQPRLVARKGGRGGGLADHYHILELVNPPPGKHTATAVVRELATKKELSRTLEFTV